MASMGATLDSPGLTNKAFQHNGKSEDIKLALT